MHPTRPFALRVLALLVLLLGLAPAGAVAAQVEVDEDEEDAEALALTPDWLEEALNEYWEEELDAAGFSYEAPEVVVYERTTETGCGNVRRTASPSYCPADETLYVSATRNESVVEESGEAYWVIEVAQAWGTAVIWQLGLTEDADEDTAAGEPEDAPFLSWCLGGAFVGAAVENDELVAGDVDDAVVEIEDAVEENAVDEFFAGYEDGLEACQLDLTEPDDGDEPGGAAPTGEYESPQYGYTITYDPDEWEVFLEDDDPDDAYDQIFFTNGPSVLGVTGDPDYDEDELTDCVDDYLFGLENNQRNSDIEPLDERGAEGEEDDRAWATFAYTYEFDDGSEGDYVRYYECVWAGDGLTLVILHDVPADEYDDQIEAREDFVAGIEVVGAEDDDEPTDEDEEEPADQDEEEDEEEEEDDDTV